MFLVEIAGMRLLYTGDYSRLPDRHLSAADLPPDRIDIRAAPPCPPPLSKHPKHASSFPSISQHFSTIRVGGGQGWVVTHTASRQMYVSHCTR